MTSEQIAEVTGTSTQAIKKLYAKIAAKVKGWRKRQWEGLLGEWPRQPESLWQEIANEGVGDTFDGHKMARQIQRRMVELGWERPRGRRALRVYPERKRAS